MSLWTYPILHGLKLHPKWIIVHGVLQICYCIGYIYWFNEEVKRTLLDYFPLFYIGIIHLIGLNLWTYRKMQRQK